MVNTSASRVVYVVDDDESALHSLLMLLRSEGLEAQGFTTAEEFLDALPEDAEGCLITDIRLPGMDGIELVEELRARGSPLPIIVVTGQADISVAVRALKAGATDFVEKPFGQEPMLRMVRDCLKAHDTAAEEQGGRRQLQARLQSLTARERQVMDLVVAGASNKMVAAQLKISPRTVEFYRANVMIKMQAENLSDLIRMSLLAGATGKRAG